MNRMKRAGPKTDPRSRSRKNLTWECNVCGKSLMNRRKMAGPKTDPSGTPGVTGTLSEEIPSRTTTPDLLLRKASIPQFCE